MIRKVIGNKFLTYASRVVVGFVLIMASVPKVAEPAAFAKSIQAYQILPPFFINVFAISIPWLELVIGIFLIFGLLLRGSSLLSAILFAAFSVLIAVSLLRGLSIDCGCFGLDGAPLSWSRFFEDIGLLLLSILIYYNSIKFFITKN
ncbi:MAG: MauE/DoxX family redox-associated membrane protein [Bacteroidota bacterium]|nr:MauE/DoxX family redox-associated membrane protein [Bacteroidota bacterium]